MAEGSNSSKIIDDVDDDGNTITLEEFLEEEQRLEIDADAVLGPGDDKNCTYNKGYIPRQALYACVTCIPQDKEDSKSAGVCLACSYHCHEGHDLIELYTKRNFRCDCGNGHFNGSKCNLEPNKSETNEKNKYNQNFKGVYCICARPYPDPDQSSDDEMLQCIICEDWYHSQHLNSDVPPEENYAEMICGTCTEKLHFLTYYIGHSVTKQVSSSDGQDISVDVSSTVECSEAAVSNKDVDNVSAEATNLMTTPEKAKECVLKTHKPLPRSEKGATFWPSNFRSILCTCESCQAMYEELGVPWITDTKDTVQSYEDKGKELNGTSMSHCDQVLKVLEGMDRFKQVEAIHSYNELKSSLVDYLAKFAQNKKVVREEDIREFFSQMQARKRQKVGGTPPYMCR